MKGKLSKLPLQAIHLAYLYINRDEKLPQEQVENL
jgi:hypothetical protein